MAISLESGFQPAPETQNHHDAGLSHIAGDLWSGFKHECGSHTVRVLENMSLGAAAGIGLSALATATPVGAAVVGGGLAAAFLVPKIDNLIHGGAKNLKDDLKVAWHPNDHSPAEIAKADAHLNQLGAATADQTAALIGGGIASYGTATIIGKAGAKAEATPIEKASAPPEPVEAAKVSPPPKRFTDIAEDTAAEHTEIPREFFSQYSDRTGIIMDYTNKFGAANTWANTIAKEEDSTFAQMGFRKLPDLLKKTKTYHEYLDERIESYEHQTGNQLANRHDVEEFFGNREQVYELDHEAEAIRSYADKDLHNPDVLHELLDHMQHARDIIYGPSSPETHA